MDGPYPMDAYAALMRLLRGRRSVRRYAAGAVSGEQLARLFDAARHAPSAHNRQPWRFAPVTDAATKDRLARAMGERLAADRRRDGDDAAEIARDVARSHARIAGAPAIVVVCASLEDMDSYPDARRAAAERAMAMQSVAMATQNLLLAAEAEGLAACWMCAPLFCPETVAETLALPDGWEPQALITLGHPAGTPPKPRGRKPLTEIVRGGPGKGHTP